MKNLALKDLASAFKAGLIVYVAVVIMCYVGLNLSNAGIV